MVAKPGTKYYYTTHGFTLVSAVLEKVSGQSFPALLKQLFIRLGMNHTSIDENFRIVPNRTKFLLIFLIEIRMHLDIISEIVLQIN